MLHLVRRFVFSLRPGVPDPAQEAWLLGRLTPGERALYEAQPVADRVHSVRCAAAVRDARGGSDALAVASALHDVGKAPAALGTPGRVLATLADRVLGRRRVLAWRDRGGLAARLAAYVEHDAVGAALLAEAGSDARTIAWAACHHGGCDDALALDEVALLRAADRG